MSRDHVDYLKRKAQQFRLLAQSYKTELSARLLSIAEELERYARRVEEDLDKEDGARPLSRGRQEAEAAGALKFAAARALAGDGIGAVKLVEFAAECQMSIEHPGNARRVRELRLRAEEARTVAEGVANASAKETLMLAAASYDKLALSLAKSS